MPWDWKHRGLWVHVSAGNQTQSSGKQCSTLLILAGTMDLPL